jgi:TonB family protein
MREKMSAIGWSSGWDSLNGLDSRRHGSLTKMMALSFFLHLFFFISLLFGRPFWSRPPAFQGYQVNLVSPGALSSTPGQGSPFSPGPGGNPASSGQGVSPPSSGEGSSPAGPGTGPERSEGLSSPSKVQAPSPAAPTVRPSVSAKASKVESKPDPERLQEWWKKAAGSIRVPAVQPKQTQPPSVFRESSRVDLTKRPTKVQPSDPSGSAFPSNPTASSNLPLSSGQAASGTGRGTEGNGSPGGSPGSTGSGQTGGGGSGFQSGIVGGGGSLGGGSGGGGSLGGTFGQFPSYWQNMENKISGQWAPPPVSAQEEGAGVIIQFKVRKDGGVESVEVLKSSGNKFFDMAAMRAVSQANPLPPFPDDLNEERLTVHYSFVVQKGS